ncbi:MULTISPECIES: alpha-ketoacid dehydrogenase subunit beta [Sporomusa]|jgi:pyruvate/2-oxoglutarate/acetoin dehydrogenase E1 component|uniref:Acetoin:2,6-dichlorophenolindophenol oxidoreductase subunit beta n=1 Tax=Sporomusa sphaeroides DSM 2875 TaxID=1337886 RepID=A0ABP2CCA4_9FIRM|nr:alpha-ketoacid dehydrogenase subunit beta [Sporomusa sphaeroides]MCM0760830.1 alpha-ketoacid dehydrogenase subunit beta [Sporomusa sphaeroides DSM 2875]OLS55230.1 acetoin:2,6-dichlorophenolindophenol oxidoreductase subunit beta [Sporomusa sphaeroides DSM 2875]CVK21506.1 Acetoin:2,6-dichlorophenolindophenol oxidoreductase subunit beta [Sporomusa sphaeroides DSM 2875]HML32186.1 alpha-ketoacid dehydrogenase subunit beta [Sporomusa sphaeroides]
MKEMTYAEAIRDGMRVEMQRDPNVFLWGEDVGCFGGCFGVTGKLFEEFPGRVIDTPISETAIVGAAVGAAAAGLRPIAEIMFIDFMGVCMDELFNQAAKMRYMFGGKAKIPMVLRTPCGAGMSAAAQHSQSMEAWFTHIPGIKTVMPSTPADAKGLLAAAIRDDNPVVYIEHKQLMGVRGEVPAGEYVIPLGKADIKREGSDVTIVAWSWMVHKALAAAEALAAEGIQAEVLDPRTLVPLDKAAILQSVGKTNKLVIVHEAVRTGGFGGEIAAIVAEEGMDYLDAPIKRVTMPDVCIPFSPVLEQAVIPSEEKIIQAVKSLF